jgi:hypothetical protein
MISVRSHGVSVEFHWWGTDGGVRVYQSNENGVVTFTEWLISGDPYYQQQVYWLILRPPVGSRFAPGNATITIHSDGTYFPDQVALPFYETSLPALKCHAAKRPPQQP